MVHRKVLKDCPMVQLSISPVHIFSYIFVDKKITDLPMICYAADCLIEISLLNGLLGICVVDVQNMFCS